MRGDERQGKGGRGRGEEVSRQESFDDVIDAAAHAMTRGEPSVRLRQTVRARIDNPRAWPALAAWLPALAGAATVVFAVFAWWTRVEPPPAQPVAATTPALAPQVAPTQRAPRLEIAAVTPPPAIPRPRVSRPVRALDPITPIVIETMTTPLMAVGTSSGEMPIEIDELRIEPLQIQ